MASVVAELGEKKKAADPAAAAIRSFVREPLLHFVILGALLFALSHYIGSRNDVATIRLTRAQIARLETNYRLQYGASPTAAELESLIERFIKNEVFYREARKLKLDQDDEIVRRRLVQKYEFLEQDLATPPPATEEELRRYFATHPDTYGIPERLSFSQVFFSVDRAGDEEARARAERALAILRSGHATRAPELGDGFPGPVDYAEVTSTQVRRALGASELSDEVWRATERSWAGPFRSGFGWHLVYVSAHEPAQTATFADVRDRVERDYLEASRAARDALAYEQLKKRYRIERE